jgi:hypothetical protein
MVTNFELTLISIPILQYFTVFCCNMTLNDATRHLCCVDVECDAK